MPNLPHRLAAAPVALLLLLVGALAQAGPAEERARLLSERAFELADSPRSAAYLYRLHDLRENVDELTLLSATYRELSEQRRTHPRVRELARHLYADTEVARGRLVSAGRLVRGLGYLTDFQIAGPFDNEGKSGCERDFGPEAKLDPAARFTSKGRTFGWRRVDAAAPDGRMDLTELVQPAEDAVVYAATRLEAKRPTRATLALGASGGHRLWLNGELISSDDEYNEARPDQRRVSVRLRKGVNTLLLKVCQQAEPLAFYARYEAPGGRARVAPLPADSLEAVTEGASADARVLPTLASELTALVERARDDAPGTAQLKGELATLLHHTRAFERARRSDVALAREAAALAPGDPWLRLLAARMEQEDPNARMPHLQAAAKDPQARPWALRALAGEALERGLPTRALVLLETLEGSDATLAGVTSARFHARRMLGDAVGAERMLEDALERHPERPYIAREGARLASGLGRTEEALRHFTRALALRFDDVSSRRELAELLLDLGRVEEALRELEVLAKLRPFDVPLRLTLARVQAANGHAKEALRGLESLGALAPEDWRIHERRARVLLERGDLEGAESALARAATLAPQNPALKNALASLQGGAPAAGADRAIDPLPLLKEADAYRHEDAVQLVDLTHHRVRSSGASSRFHQLAVQVNSDRGVRAFRQYGITYAPDRQSVSILKARVVKADGAIVDGFDEREQSVNEPWSEMYYDTRAKVLRFPALEVGDLLELQYRIDDTQADALLGDYWGTIAYARAPYPRLRFRLEVDMPSARPLHWNRTTAGAGVRYRAEKTAGERVLHTWAIDEVPRVVTEPGMPGWAEIATPLHVSTFRTWDAVGDYYWKLVREQLVPDASVRETAARLLEGVDRDDTRAVVERLYGFVVTQTRYVALEFGIHGFKPYRVDRVLARRFGDCKDKASLIHALLASAGVDSRLVLLRMRHLGTLAEEPASLSAFNHAILYVPELDLYLDGTAELHGTGELPGADRIANVLIVEPEGESRFLTIPEARPEDNATSLELNLALEASGAATVSGTTAIQGQAAPSYREAYRASDSRRSRFERSWGGVFPGVSVASVEVSDLSRLEQPVTMRFEMRAPRFAQLREGALTFRAFATDPTYAQRFAPFVERRHDLVLPRPTLDRFRYAYSPPPGYALTALPEPVELESRFGRLRVEYLREDGAIVAAGELELGRTRISAEEYPEFREFMLAVDRHLSRRLTLDARAPEPTDEKAATRPSP